MYAINKASAREKSIRHRHPSTLHLWWSRKPLATCRAVLWASLVDDPSAHPERFPSEEDQAVERKRLFGILEDLVVWENSNNSDVLGEAKAEVEKCFDGELPAVLDPFAGGGSIPLEAQRLGLEALAGDLNPVAVLINKALVEIPPRFAGLPPVHPDAREDLSTWAVMSDSGKRSGAHGLSVVDESYGSRKEQAGAGFTWDGVQGLAADIRAYGAWMRDEAERRIGHLYPDAVGPDGEMLIPIAWCWARTVRSPDPAWGGHVPLVSSWVLRNRKGKPKVWVEPVVDSSSKAISYKVNYGGGGGGYEPTVRRGNGTCIATGAAIPVEYIRAEGRAGRMGAHLLAVVGVGDRGRVYCEPSPADINACREAVKLSADVWKPAGYLPPRGKGLGFRVQAYGYEEWWQLFTDRQLLALTTFSDLLHEVHGRVLKDAKTAGLADDEVRLREGGTGDLAYAEAVVTYLALVLDKCADYWSSVCTWNNPNEQIRGTFPRQAIAMNWDYAEANPFSSSTGSWMAMVNWVGKAVDHLPSMGMGESEVCQQDARVRVRNAGRVVVSTDPPYYDNIGYADISDFFYVWLRHNLGDVWPEECATLLTPKASELIADPSRHESKQDAKGYFHSGMAEFMSEVASAQHPDVPATIYYAYKATEDTEDGSVRSTGWDTFLQAVIKAGLQVTATWPLRTERSDRPRSLGANALASSIVLACRSRSQSASLATRSEFIAALREELPEAIEVLQSGNVALVDLPQSTIGPGIGVFSRYAKVVGADGSSMPVSDALAIINEVLDEVLNGVESEFDSDTRFALAWYEQNGFEAGLFGHADSIARAKNTSVEGVEKAGVGKSSGGKFYLYRRSDLVADWDPVSDSRLTAWEALQHLVARLEQSESEAVNLLARLGGVGDRARQLAYRLHKIANDNQWVDEALAYNDLIDVWPTLRSTIPRGTQQKLIE